MCVGSLIVCKSLNDLTETFKNVVWSLCSPNLDYLCEKSIETLSSASGVSNVITQSDFNPIFDTLE